METISPAVGWLDAMVPWDSLFARIQEAPDLPPEEEPEHAESGETH